MTWRDVLLRVMDVGGKEAPGPGHLRLACLRIREIIRLVLGGYAQSRRVWVMP